VPCSTRYVQTDAFMFFRLNLVYDAVKMAAAGANITYRRSRLSISNVHRNVDKTENISIKIISCQVCDFFVTPSSAESYVLSVILVILTLY